MRRSRSLLVAGLLLAAAQRARADIIVLDGSTPQGQAEIQRIAATIAPAQLYPVPGSRDQVLRCRIINHTPGPKVRLPGGPAPGGGPPPTLIVEAWWASAPGATPVWAGNPNFRANPPQRPTPVNVPLHVNNVTIIRHVEHEADGHLDLQLLISSRDEQQPALGQPIAPMGSAMWRKRMLAALDPNGAIGVVQGAAEPPEPAILRWSHNGTLLHQLRDVRPQCPPSLGQGQASLDPEVKRWFDADPRRRQAGLVAVRQWYDGEVRRRQQAYHTHLSQSGWSLLDERVVSRPPAENVRVLLEGIARLRSRDAQNRPRYAFLKDCIDTELVIPIPAGQTGVGRTFEDRALIVLGFMCTLSRVQAPPAGAPAPASATDPFSLCEPAHARYQRYGLEARDAVLTLLEAASDENVAKGLPQAGQAGTVLVAGTPPLPAGTPAPPGFVPVAPVALPAAAALPVDALDVASAVIALVQRFPAFWLAESSEGRRLVRALVDLARDAGPSATSARKTLGLEARETLVRLLRADLNPEATPAERQALRAHTAKFQRDLEGMFTHQDPAVRAAVQTVLLHAGRANVVTTEAIEDLFALAVGEGQVDADDQTVRRATRRYAVSVLTLLGVMADPNVGADQDDRRTGEAVLGRLQVLRDVVESGQGSRGETELVDLLDRLHLVVREEDLRDRVRRFQALERDHVQRRFRESQDERRRLERMVMDNGAAVMPADVERLRRARDDERRFGRRSDRLREDGPSSPVEQQ